MDCKLRDGNISYQLDRGETLGFSLGLAGTVDFTRPEGIRGTSEGRVGGLGCSVRSLGLSLGLTGTLGFTRPEGIRGTPEGTVGLDCGESLGLSLGLTGTLGFTRPEGIRGTPEGTVGLVWSVSLKLELGGDFIKGMIDLASLLTVRIATLSFVEPLRPKIAPRATTPTTAVRPSRNLNVFEVKQRFPSRLFSGAQLPVSTCGEFEGFSTFYP